MTSEPLYAKWEDIQQAILDAATGVLVDDDPMQPASEDDIAWAGRCAKRIAEGTMRQLDGYSRADLGEPHDK